MPVKHWGRNLLYSRHSTPLQLPLLWIVSRKHFEDDDKLACRLWLCLTSWSRNPSELVKCYQASLLQLFWLSKKAMHAWPFHTIFNSITDRAWIIVSDNSRANRLCPHFPMVPLAPWHSVLHEDEGTGGSTRGARGSCLISSPNFVWGHNDLNLAWITHNHPPSKWICANWTS